MRGTKGGRAVLLTSALTASTVFSSPCLRRESEALCRNHPKRRLKVVMYLWRGSKVSANAKPALTGSTSAIISGISSLGRNKICDNVRDRGQQSSQYITLGCLTTYVSSGERFLPREGGDASKCVPHKAQKPAGKSTSC